MKNRPEQKKEWKRNNRIANRIYLQEYKAAHRCTICEESRSYCLVFHHRDPTTKKFDISLSRDKAFSAILSEVKKCDVICANCHLELHALQRLAGIETILSLEDDGGLLF